jgi:hypothetical protein
LDLALIDFPALRDRKSKCGLGQSPRKHLSPDEFPISIGAGVKKGQILNVTGQSTNTLIYNNVIYTGTENNAIVVHRRWGDSGSVWPSSTSYYNNIFYMNKSNPKFDFQSSTGNLFRANVFYGNNSPSEPNDAQKMTSDPQFENPGTGTMGISGLDGYKLKSTSPCINSGFKISNFPLKDFWGNNVPDGATQLPDRGAHEFSKTVSAFEKMNSQELLIFPNPGYSDNLVFQFNPPFGIGDYQLNLFSILGENMAHQTVQVTNIFSPTAIYFTSKLQPGIYFLKIQNENFGKTVKLVLK